MQNVVTGSQLKSELSDMVAAGGPYENPKMILITNEADIPPEAALADVDQPTFTGYGVSTAVTWGTPHIDADGNAVVLGNPKEFKCTADSTEETVHHVGLVSNDGLTLLRTARLADPIVFSNPSHVYLIGFPLTHSQPKESPEGIYP